MKKLKLTDAIVEYENLIRKRPENTKKNHLREIRNFSKWLKEEHRIEYIEDIPKYMMHKYRTYREERGAGSEAVNTYFSYLKTFFWEMYDNDYTEVDFSTRCKRIDENTAKQFKGTRQKNFVKGAGGLLSLSQQKKLLAAAQQGDNGEHDMLMIYTAISNGMRSSEVVSLKVKDIDFEEETITIVGKGNKERTFFIYSEDWLNKIKAYIEKENLNDDDYIFYSPNGGTRKIKIAVYKGEEHISTFGSATELSAKSLEVLGHKIRLNSISDCINGKRDGFLGFTFVKIPAEIDRSIPISIHVFANIYRESLKRSGIPAGKANGGFTPHDCRRTNITARLEANEVMSDVSKDVGHSNINTTQGYYKPELTEEKKEKKRKIYKKAALFGGID